MTHGVDKTFVPAKNRIFVFGSNRRGIHGAGAARTAYEQYGALWRHGEGLQGQSYAIPTKDDHLRSLPLVAIAEHVERFLAFARVHEELSFFVTRIGCGWAGYVDGDISPLFRGAPKNCELPLGWSGK